MLLGDMRNALTNLAIAHVLPVEYCTLPYFYVAIITVNQELPMTTITLHIISVTHCGMDLVAIQVSVVATLPSHCSIMNRAGPLSMI